MQPSVGSPEQEAKLNDRSKYYNYIDLYKWNIYLQINKL